MRTRRLGWGLVTVALAACARTEPGALHAPRTAAHGDAAAEPVQLEAVDRRCGAPAGAPFAGRVVAITASRLSPHADARVGDLELQGDGRTSIIVGARPAPPGHRPLEGAILDVALDGIDAPDPLLWLRPGFRDAEDKVHPLVAREIARVACAAGEGVRTTGTIDGAAFEQTICAESGGAYRVRTRATGLPAGAELVDELNAGTSPVLLEGDGGAWEGEAETRLVALGEHGVGLLVELGCSTPARRKLVHIGSETFPAAVVLRHGGAMVERVLRVVRGDALDALALSPLATRAIAIDLGTAGGAATVLAAGGRELATAELRGARSLRLPAAFGAAIALHDAAGIPLGPPRALAPTVARGADTARGEVELAYSDPTGKPLPVHVLVRGHAGAGGTTPDPTPRALAGSPRAVTAGPSLYLVEGRARIALAPGTYDLLATHGPTWSLARQTITVASGATIRAGGKLANVVDTRGWTSADFHLHAAPSPDAPVPLEDRVASLACEGVDLAVATDHNHVTDYAPAAARAGVDGRALATVIGDEVTSAGKTLWGHFNAFPLPAGSEAPAYFDVGPTEIFAAARRAGARVVQVNHPRMPPRIGYFDLVHLDPATGVADEAFSGDFDALEVFNGIWLETPDRVREGARDLVALARRGLRRTATGNSDSHRLLFEEAGWPRTWVHVASEPAATRAARVVEALGRGDTSVSSGPLVELTVDGKRPGATITATGRARVTRVTARVRVWAPAWVPVEHVEIWRDAVIVKRFDVTAAPKDGLRFEGSFDVPIDADATVLAWADAETPLPPVLPYPAARAIGFTGLVYVDADGDGKVVVPRAP